MKSIGEISIAPLPGGISGILEALGAGKRQPQEPQHSDPKGEAGSTAAARCAPFAWGRNKKNPNAKKDRFPPSSGKPYGAMWERGFPPLGCARLFGSLRPRARRLTALRLENGRKIPHNELHDGCECPQPWIQDRGGEGNTPRLQRAHIMTSKPGGPEGNARVWGLAVPREAISAQSPDHWFFIRAGYVAVEQPINRSLSHSGGGLRQKPPNPGVPLLQQNLRLKATICEDCLGHERHCRSVPREIARKARPEKHRA